MNQHTFQEQYKQAIMKIAVGFFIIDDVGSRLGYAEEMMEQNKKDLCIILSQGIGISPESILEDASRVYLPAEYLREIRTSGLLEELRNEMSHMKLEILTQN
jgi:hypothetical protein